MCAFIISVCFLCPLRLISFVKNYEDLTLLNPNLLIRLLSANSVHSSEMSSIVVRWAPKVFISCSSWPGFRNLRARVAKPGLERGTPALEAIYRGCTSDSGDLPSGKMCMIRNYFTFMVKPLVWYIKDYKDYKDAMCNESNTLSQENLRSETLNFSEFHNMSCEIRRSCVFRKRGCNFPPQNEKAFFTFVGISVQGEKFRFRREKWFETWFTTCDSQLAGQQGWGDWIWIFLRTREVETF